MGLGPADLGPGDARAAAELRQARVDAAVRAGWVIRFDPDRLEYRAARELLTARTLDLLLGAIEAGNG